MTLPVLIDLHPSAWRHPEDVRLSRGFQRLPFAGRLLDRAHADQAHVAPHPGLGSVVPLSERSVAFDLYREVLRTLDAPARWPVFVAPCPSRNAMVVGGPEPYIVLTEGLVREGDPDRLRFAMGHEVGHIMAEHCSLHWVLRRLGRVGWGALPFDPLLGGAAVLGAKIALQSWCRAGELSADRAGLLAIQDPVAAHRCLSELATGPPPEGPFAFIGSLFATHPERQRRVASLAGWVQGGGYDAILAGDYPRRSVDTAGPVDAEEAALLLAARRELAELGLYGPQEDAWREPAGALEAPIDELTAAIEAAARGE